MKFFRLLIINVLVLLSLLLLLEGGLRLLTAAPEGKYRGFFAGQLGLYPENSRLPMLGVTNWVVKTNRWGFRGSDVAREKTPGVQRIAMVGDSVTDGFYVENEDTYPAYLERDLREAGASVEVINTAHGGSTINRQLAILRDVVTPFVPDTVVLTFVTNDICGLDEVTDDHLLNEPADLEPRGRQLLRALFVHTAAGEWILDNTLRYISPAFAEAQDRQGALPDLPADRYRIEGGEQFAANSALFLQRYANKDGQILHDTFAPSVQHNVTRYLLAWDRFMAHAREHGMQPVFVYFPAYPQVYDVTVSMKVRDLLQQHAEAAGVPFLDLTPALRQQGTTVLHLAPKDYHLNPQGNQVIARALADFLLQHGQVKPAVVPTSP